MGGRWGEVGGRWGETGEKEMGQMGERWGRQVGGRCGETGGRVMGADGREMGGDRWEGGEGQVEGDGGGALKRGQGEGHLPQPSLTTGEVCSCPWSTTLQRSLLVVAADMVAWDLPGSHEGPRGSPSEYPSHPSHPRTQQLFWQPSPFGSFPK